MTKCILEGGKFLDTRNKSQASHTLNSFLINLHHLHKTISLIQSTGKILLQSKFLKMFKYPSAGDLMIYSYQMTAGCKFVDVLLNQIKYSPQHVKLVVYYFLWH